MTQSSLVEITNQRVSLKYHIFWQLDSTSSITRSATTTETAAMDLLVEGVTEGKKVAFRENSSKVVISSVVTTLLEHPKDQVPQ